MSTNAIQHEMLLDESSSQDSHLSPEGEYTNNNIEETRKADEKIDDVEDDSSDSNDQDVAVENREDEVVNSDTGNEDETNLTQW